MPILRKPAQTRRKLAAAIEALEDRTLLASTFVYMPSIFDLAFDNTRNLLYASLDNGTLARYDVTTKTLLAPLSVGTSLRNMDITPDDGALYVADYFGTTTQGYFRKITLSDGSVSTLAYDREPSEVASWDIAITNNGKAFATTLNNFTTARTLREIDLATDTMTLRPEAGTNPAPIDRSADRSTLFFQSRTFADAPITLYRSSSNDFITRNTGPLGLFNPGAISRDGSLIAMPGTQAMIMDSSLRIVKSLSTIDGGMVFDPNRDVLYGINNTAGQIIAYDTNTWREKYRLSIGETLIGYHQMSINSAGALLFLTTGTGFRMIDIPQPTGNAQTATISGFPSYVKAGITHNVTVRMFDAAGDPATNYRGTIHFTGNAVDSVPADYTFTASDNGTHTFSVTLNALGSRGITITDAANSLTASQTSITIHNTSSTSLVPFGGSRDMVFDPNRGILYMATTTSIQRYDLANNSLLPGIVIGGAINGFDVTPDGNFLYVADGTRGPGQAILKKVELTTGAISNITYQTNVGLSSFTNVVIANNGKAFAYAASGASSSALVEIDLATDIATPRADYPTNLSSSRLIRSLDRTGILLIDGLPTGGEMAFYSTATNTFSRASAGVPINLFSPAVSRNGQLSAILLNGAGVMDSSMDSVLTVAGIDVGLAFDPQRDVLYGVNSTTDEIIAFNTNTWAEKYRLPVGENIATLTSFKPITLTDDGTKLFYTTPAGLRIYNLPQPTGQAVTAKVSGFPRLAKRSSAPGSTFTAPVTVTMLDPSGSPAVNYRGTVHFTTEVAAIVPPDYTFTADDAGSHTFNITFTSGGTAAIIVTDTANPALTGRQGSIAVYSGFEGALPFTGQRHHVVDPIRNILYVATSSGIVERYNVATGSTLTPFVVGGLPSGIDVTPDGNFLYVADGVRGPTQGIIHKINTTTGQTTRIGYAPVTAEGGAFDLTIAANGKAFFTTTVRIGATLPASLRLREIDLATGAVTIRNDYGNIPANSLLNRSADRQTLILQEATSNRYGRYDAATNLWAKSTAATVIGTAPGALSRDGHLFAIGVNNGATILNSSLNVVKTIPNINGGMIFDPVANMFYGIDANLRTINAYDTANWILRYSRFLPAAVNPAGPMVSGQLSFNADGTTLFINTLTGIAEYHPIRPSYQAKTLGVSGFPSLVKTGVTETFTLEALGPAFETANLYRGTVRFTSNDPTAILPPDYTFTEADNGTHTFSITFNSPGIRTITATDITTASITGTQNSITIHSGVFTRIPAAGYREIVFDTNHGMIYASTANGTIERFNLTTQSLMHPLVVGGSLNGMDVTPDGNFLYVADGLVNGTQATVRKINLATGQVTNLTYTLSNGETGAWDIAIAANGRALLTTMGGSSVALRQIDLATDTITNRNDYTSIRGNSLLNRNSDHSQIFLQESGSSSVGLYHSATNNWTKGSANLGATAPAAVSPNGQLIAKQVNETTILNSNLSTIRTIPAINGGLLFDPTRSVLYGVHSGSDAIAAYDTNTWALKYTFSIGEGVNSASAMGAGQMGISQDAKTLFLTTNSGIRVIPVPQPTGLASRFEVSGFPAFVKTGVANTITVRGFDPTSDPAINYRGTIHFTSSDPSAILPPPYTFTAQDNGVHTFDVTFNSPGGHSIIVQDPATLANGTQSGITIHSGSPALLPITGQREIVSDPTRGILYISTTAGAIERFNLNTESLLTPITLSTTLNGFDITPDGNFLYVADGATAGNQAFIKKVNLTTGAVTNLAYDRNPGELAALDVAIASNGLALISTDFFTGSGVTTLRQIDLATDAITTRSDFDPVDRITLLNRSPNYEAIFLQGSNTTNGRISLYDPATNTFRKFSAGFFAGQAPAAISRNYALLAMRTNGLTLLDSNLQILRTLPGLDGGLVFDSIRDVVYAVNSTSNEVVAHNTNTFDEKYRITVGENVNPALDMGIGQLAINSDATKLFLTTATGIRILNIPQPTGIASTISISGYPTFAKAGSHGSVTVTLRDTAGEPATLYRGTVHFTSSDPAAILPADYTFTAADNGSHTFDVVLNSTGTRSISVTNVGPPSLTATQLGITIHNGPISVPLPESRDLVFDHIRNILYATTGTGVIQRYDLTTQSLLSPVIIGSALYGADITPDGRYLLVADANREPTQGVVHKIDLDTGAIAKLRFDIEPHELGVWDVSIASNNRVMITTHASGGSGWTTAPLRQLDLSAGVFTERRLTQNKTSISRDPSGNVLFFHGGSSEGYTYDSASDTFPGAINLVTSRTNPTSAVSRNGSLTASDGWSDGTRIYRSSDLFLVRTLPGIFGGVLFHPTLDLLIAINASTDQLVAYSTIDWSIKWQAPLGYNANPSSSMQSGIMSMSSDGHWLFVETFGGMRAYNLEGSPVISGFTPVRAAGQTGSFTVSAISPTGVIDLGYRGTVHFTSDDPNATLPPDYTFTAADNGVHTFTASFNTVGHHTMSVTDVATGSVFTQSDIVVSGFNITSRVLNIFGTDGDDNIQLTSSNGAFQLRMLGANHVLDPSQFDSLKMETFGGSDFIYHTGYPLNSSATLLGGTIDFGPGDDYLHMDDGSSTLPITVSGGDGSDQARLSSGARIDLVFDGGTGSDIVWFLSGNENDTINVTSTSISSAARTATFTNTEIPYASAGGGSNTLNVLSVLPTQTPSLNGGDGDDTINFLGGLSSGLVRFRTGGGTNSIYLAPSFQGSVFQEDPTEGINSILIVGTDAAEQARILESAASVGARGVSNTRAVSVHLNLMGGSDELFIQPFAGPYPRFTIDGGDGHDIFNAYSAFGDAVTLFGGEGNDLITGHGAGRSNIIFDGGPGTDSAIFVGTDVADTIQIGASLVTSTSSAGNNSLAFTQTESLRVIALTGNDTINVNADTIPITVEGTTGNDVLNINAGTFTLNQDANATSTSLSINVASNAQLLMNSSQHLAALTIQSGARATLSANGSRVLVTNQLQISGTLDLTNNSLIIQSTSANRLQDLAATQNSIKSAYNSSPTHWQNPGLTSSTAAANPSRALGVVLNSTSASYTNFRGQFVDANSILVAYTLVGDLNLDKSVSISDFIDLTAHFNGSSATWGDGDVNYDGSVTIGDLIDLAANFGAAFSAAEPLVALQPAASAVADPIGNVVIESLVAEKDHLGVNEKRRRPFSRSTPRRQAHHRRHHPKAGFKWRSRAGAY